MRINKNVLLNVCKYMPPCYLLHSSLMNITNNTITNKRLNLPLI